MVRRTTSETMSGTPVFVLMEDRDSDSRSLCPRQYEVTPLETSPFAGRDKPLFCVHSVLSDSEFYTHPQTVVYSSLPLYFLKHPEERFLFVPRCTLCLGLDSLTTPHVQRDITTSVVVDQRKHRVSRELTRTVPTVVSSLGRPLKKFQNHDSRVQNLSTYKLKRSTSKQSHRKSLPFSSKM